jgi:hypothetical protein
MATKTKKISAETLAKKIDDGGDSVTLDEGSGFGRNLDKHLRDLGWKTATSYSECSKASFESHLKKGDRRIEIVCASFMGVFTQVSVWDHTD